MNDFFKDLFWYNHDCNERLAALIVSHAGQVSDKTLHLFSHILNAHHIWNSRILKQQSAYTRLQVHSLQDLKPIELQNHMGTLSVIDSGLLTEELNYVNTLGEQAFSRVQDILFHVANHSTYHRGQIASDLKQSGIEPPVTDFIFYKR